MSLINKNKELIEENELKKEVKQKLKEITQLEDNLKKNKNEDIKQMIKYYRNMTVETEDRRTRLNSVNLQTLAISVAAIVWIITNCQKFANLYLGDIFYIFILSILIILAGTCYFQFFVFHFNQLSNIHFQN